MKDEMYYEAEGLRNLPAGRQVEVKILFAAFEQKDCSAQPDQ